MTGKRGKSGRRRLKRKRTPSGQLSRAKADLVMDEAAEAARAVAAAARVRQLGLPPEWAIDQRAGSVVGCMAIRWVLDTEAKVALAERQGLPPEAYEAALHWLELQQAYRRVMGSGRGVRIGEGRGGCDECGRTVHCDLCAARSSRAIRRAHDKAEAVILQHCRELRSAAPLQAMLEIVERDQPGEAYAPALRGVLQRLHRHFAFGAK